MLTRVKQTTDKQDGYFTMPYVHTKTKETLD